MVNERALRKQKKKLLRYIELLESDFTDIIDTTKKKVERSKTVTALQALVAVNIFLAVANTDKVQSILSTVRDAYLGGINYAPGTNNRDLLSFSEIISTGANEFITKMGDDMKDELIGIVTDGFNSGMSIDDISLQLQDSLDLSRGRANAIARTEVMRANNAGAYLQAKDQGYTHWVADMRDEACEICQDEYAGIVFTIDQTEMLPPAHPNCACIPEFFNSEQEGQVWADEISNAQDNTDNPGGEGAWPTTTIDEGGKPNG